MTGIRRHDTICAPARGADDLSVEESTHSSSPSVMGNKELQFRVMQRNGKQGAFAMTPSMVLAIHSYKNVVYVRRNMEFLPSVTKQMFCFPSSKLKQKRATSRPF